MWQRWLLGEPANEVGESTACNDGEAAAKPLKCVPAGCDIADLQVVLDLLDGANPHHKCDGSPRRLVPALEPQCFRYFPALSDFGLRCFVPFEGGSGDVKALVLICTIVSAGFSGESSIQALAATVTRSIMPSRPYVGEIPLDRTIDMTMRVQRRGILTGLHCSTFPNKMHHLRPSLLGIVLSAVDLFSVARRLYSPLKAPFGVQTVG